MYFVIDLIVDKDFYVYIMFDGDYYEIVDIVGNIKEMFGICD